MRAGTGRELGVDEANFPRSCPARAYLRQSRIFEGTSWGEGEEGEGIGNEWGQLLPELPRTALPSTISDF